jgi:hypothetical protein
MPIPFRQHTRRQGCRSQSNAGAVAGVLSKSPAAAHGLVGLPRAWMPELRQRRSGCPMPGKRRGGSPSLGYFSWRLIEK